MNSILRASLIRKPAAPQPDSGRVVVERTRIENPERARVLAWIEECLRTLGVKPNA